MKLRGIVAEDFSNYKEPSMFLITAHCNWKCCREAGIPTEVCQNHDIAKEPIQNYSDDRICEAYIGNKITRAVVIGGLEPMLQFEEVFSFISTLREKKCYDTVVIYTGYNEGEIPNEIKRLKSLGNIIVKFGRYIPNSNTVFDKVLGVTLASDNQYAKRID